MASSVSVLPESVVPASRPEGSPELGQSISDQIPVWRGGWVVYLVSHTHAVQVPGAPVRGRRGIELGEKIMIYKHIFM